MSNTLDIIPAPGFINTREFESEARKFLKTGTYINAPRGTFAYREYWEEQTRRCKEGYTVAGIRITGEHYFYLNFSQIKATVKEGGVKRTRLTFPKFLDVDYYFFHEKEKARLNDQGLIVAKSRRKGFSFKNSSLCAYNFIFLRDSTSIIGAYLDEYSQATMYMTLDVLNFVNKNTAWAKRRNPDRKDHVKARFKEIVEGKEVWAGYNSEIYTLTFKDNFSAAIGKKAELFLFEEAGKWPNLIQSYMVTAPVFRDGAEMIGMPIIFGTGGDMDGGSNDFAEMFYNPEKYWLRPYVNEWDEGSLDSVCGLFIDDMWYKPGKVHIKREDIAGKEENFPELTKKFLKSEEDEITFDMVDINGNSNREAAEFWLDNEREVMKTSDSRTTWEKYITQFPKNPQEAFLQVSGNIFPTIELQQHLGKIETLNRASPLGQTGDLYWDTDKDGKSKVRWMPNPNKRPVAKFPIKDNEDKEGAVVIWEHPYKDHTGATPFGLYIAGTDPYDQDSSTTASLGSTIIYKTFQDFDNTYNIIVAEYTGRPETAKEYYENIRKLLEYYSAQTLYENNLRGLKIYFEQKKCLHLLKNQPTILKDIVPGSKTQRGYGIHMSDPIKTQGEIYIRDWLLEERGQNSEGETTRNLDTIYSVPLLQELISYTKRGNFDRVIAFMLCMFHSQENHRVQVKEERKSSIISENSFFNRPLFKKRR
jgi:hypothetical protein